MSDGQRSMLPGPGRRFTVARIGPISIKVDPSWFIWLALLTVIARQWDRTGITMPLPLSVALALVLSACVVAHELAHSFVAIALGLPVRTITLFMLGGVSQMEKEAPDARSEYLIALAGPLTSLVLATIFGAIARTIHPLEGSFNLSTSDRFPGMWGFLAWMNIVLAMFNLVPAFPMDGGRILRSALWKLNGSRAKATRVASVVGRSFGGIMIALGLVAFLASVVQKQRDVSLLWLAIIGLFVYNAASSSGRAEGAEQPNQPPTVV